MKVLVTGTNGFVGKAFISEAKRQELPVRGAVRRSDAILPGCECVVVGDVNGNTDWHDALAGATEVVHLAARAHITHETAEDSLAAFRTINTEGTLNLARQAAQAGVRRFVFVSTIKVNGEGRETPYTEVDTPVPEDAYAISKCEAELGLRDIAARTGMEIVVLRAPLVYGPGVGANFLHLMQAVDRGWPLPLGGVNNRRSLIYLDNLVDAIIACLTHPAVANKMFLLSDGDDVSTPELIRRLAIALGRPAKLFPVPSILLKTASFALGKQKVAERLLGSLRRWMEAQSNANCDGTHAVLWRQDWMQLLHGIGLNGTKKINEWHRNQVALFGMVGMWGVKIESLYLIKEHSKFGLQA